MGSMTSFPPPLRLVYPPFLLPHLFFLVLVVAFPAGGWGVSVATDGTLLEAEVCAVSLSPSAAAPGARRLAPSSRHGQTSLAHGRRPPALRTRTGSGRLRRTDMRRTDTDAGVSMGPDFVHARGPG
ncbi:hypothetical protein B0H14DRAFT_1474452 [Mycena olivaceomarginata]|nr:hypothetical protein B0H14DRAFT_1474452 [Mycena olivaceomarginata]